jgi:glutamate--cysteine ligase
MKGILYEEDCLLAAWDLIKNWTWEEREELYNTAHRAGLNARIRKLRLADLASELFVIASAGLERQHQVNSKGDDERVYLEWIGNLIKRGTCPAERVIEKWKGGWDQDIARMVADSAYRGASRGEENLCPIGRPGLRE